MSDDYERLLKEFRQAQPGGRTIEHEEAGGLVFPAFSFLTESAIARVPKAWGRVGNTATGGAPFTKHTREVEPLGPCPPSCDQEAWDKANVEYRRVAAKVDPKHPRLLHLLEEARKLAFGYAHQLDSTAMTEEHPEMNRKPGRLANLDLRSL